MDPRDVSNLFALALLAGMIALVVALARPASRPLVSRFAPAIVSAAAIGATLGSLYFSEVADYVPCTLCWYQRIAMYPLAVIMPLSILLRDRRALRYSLALGTIGLGIAIYHIQLQLFPDQSSNVCELTSPCTAKWVEAFGFVTIPQMAGATFVIIIAASIVGLRVQPGPAAPALDDEAELQAATADPSSDR